MNPNLNDNPCVCCGEYAVEGAQLCWKCINDKQPTPIDPVHAANGVYCHECCYFDTRGYEPDYYDESLNMGHCSYWSKDTQACNFCSQGY